MPARRLFARTAAGTFVVELQPDGRATVRRDEGPRGDREPAPSAAIELSATDAGDGQIHLTVNGRRRLAWAVDAGSVRWVFLDGNIFQFEVGERLPAPHARRRTHGPESLGTPMPATVVKVLVQPGQIVSKGQSLIVLEAMKMELPLRAPHEATVKSVRCVEGELVQPGTPLVELEGGTP